jgi:Ser-tRNA(Ala) deacylase AlaX
VQVREALRVGLDAVHLCDGPLQVGERIRITIDWDRRLDLVSSVAIECACMT